jgi:hypothetical protein
MALTRLAAPAGGSGGADFADDAIAPSAKVREVHIRSGAYVDAIQIVHEVAGVTNPMPIHGGNGGALHVFSLDPDEYIIGIGGRWGKYVDSIYIQTNKQTSPLYGRNNTENTYYFQAPEGSEIVGFFGRAGALVDAIGALARKRS